jgi:hypothetical protein
MHGQHSLSPNENQELKTNTNTNEKGTPLLIQQGKHSENKSKLKEEAGYRFNQYQDPYSSKRPTNYGTAAQKGMARRVEELPSISKIADQVNEFYKMDNLGHINDYNFDHEQKSMYHYDQHEQALEDHYHRSYGIHPELFKYSEGSWVLNDHLWESYKNKTEPNERAGGINIREMDSALSDVQLHKPLYVFSGVKRNPGMLAAMHPKRRIFLPSYTSTSIEPRTALSFAGSIKRGTESEENWSNDQEGERHILRIHVPAGNNGHYLGTKSNFDNEKEFLLPRNTSIHVEENPQTFVHKNPSGGPLSKRLVSVWNARVLRPHEID